MKKTDKNALRRKSKEKEKFKAVVASAAVSPPSTLFPVVVQDAQTRAVLMLAYADREALRRTRRTRSAWFYSRSRQCYWDKGATSGNSMRVLDVRWDCDRDALLYLVKPSGPACHTGASNCFGMADAFNLETLESVIARRAASGGKTSFTRRVLADPALLDRKVMEEAFELTSARTRAEVAWEAADVLYFALVKLRQKKVPLARVLDELKRRHNFR